MSHQWFSLAVQILVLTVAYYYVLLFFKGGRGAQILAGLVLMLALLVGITQIFSFDVLNWLLRRLWIYFAFALLVVFQPEIRRALAEIGRQPIIGASYDRAGLIESMVRGVMMIADGRIGALIAIEREIGTRTIQETGVRIDARVQPELLVNIFFPRSPLHDGGVIITGDRIAAAGCVFPLSSVVRHDKHFGTRHRAAIGISEETDALVVVVSEETGTVSVCYRGKMSRGFDEDRLRRFLSSLLMRERRGISTWRRVRAQLDLTFDGLARRDMGRGRKERS